MFELDPIRVQQVLINLLSNAFKFSQNESDVLVIVSTDDNLKLVTISVVDFGIGISNKD